MLSLPMIFKDHMVLQREKPIEIWGQAAPGGAVAVSLARDGETVASAETAVRSDGAWSLCLPAQEAGRDFQLTVSSGEGTVTLRDVLVGEVWIAGGQSNMEFFLQFDAERETAFGREEDPDVRFFDYPEISYEGELEDYDFSEFGFWRSCRREDLPWWSAVGYWFSARLRQDMDVPIGIVGCNWGGTRACCWIGREYLEGTPGEAWLRDYEEGIRGVDPGAYRKSFLSVPNNINNHPLEGDVSIMDPGFSREFQLKVMEFTASLPKPPFYDIIGQDHPWRPCGLYETMLRKIVPYTCRGVIWYQGESDEVHPEIYDRILSILVRNWRDLWHDELPFLMVQLAPFGAWLDNGSEAYPTLRDRQERAAGTIPGVWLASSSDSGMEWDIHPKHKRPIGERLAMLALGHIYGKELQCDAPVCDSARWEEGRLVLTFRHGQGLYIGGPEGAKQLYGLVNALLVDGESVSGSVEGDKLVISAHRRPRRVELAQCGYYQVNLYNGAGIPAMPFGADVE